MAILARDTAVKDRIERDLKAKIRILVFSSTTSLYSGKAAKNEF